MKKIAMAFTAAITVCVIAVTWLVAAMPWQKWHATDAERARTLPGYELVPEPVNKSVMAITINVSPEKVWPWVNQLGRDRGGLYSYDFLENLVGSQIKNADKVHPEWQYTGKAGEKMFLHPKIPGLPLVKFVPGKLLAFNGGTLEKYGRSIPAGKAKPADYNNTAWIIYLEDAGNGKTRLYSSWRYDYLPNFANEMGYGPRIVGLLNFIMSDAMLRGIKARAEGGGWKAEGLNRKL
jgi:hypothetical protein